MHIEINSIILLNELLALNEWAIRTTFCGIATVGDVFDIVQSTVIRLFGLEQRFSIGK